MNPRIPHLLVLLSIYLSENQELRDYIYSFINVIQENIDNIKIFFIKLIDKYIK